MRRAASVEADRVAALADLTVQVGHIPIDRAEWVADQSRSDYQCPPFMVKTAGPELAAELDGLLADMWRVNQAHIGENTLEVTSHFTFTGEADDLEEGFRRWFDAYLRVRTDRARLSPRLARDPFLLFAKVFDEAGEVLGALATRPHSLNFRFLNLSQAYVPWLLAHRVVRPAVVSVDNCTYAPIDHPTDPTSFQMAVQTLADCQHRQRLFNLFVRHAVAAARGATPEQFAASESVLRDAVAGMVADIQQMRVFLLSGYKPFRSVVRVADDLWAAWMFTSGHGGVIGRLAVGRTEQETRRAARATTCEFGGLSVRRSGTVCSYWFPWMTVDRVPGVTPRDGLAVAHAILAPLRVRLFDFFDRIDFDRVRRRARAAGPIWPDAALAISCLDLARRADASPPGRQPSAPRQQLPGLRFSQLLRVLGDHFDCEVTAAKGSEVKLYRPGGHIFTCGHHKADPEVHPTYLRRVLRRLGIPEIAWLGAVYGTA